MIRSLVIADNFYETVKRAKEKTEADPNKLVTESDFMEVEKMFDTFMEQYGKAREEEKKNSLNPQPMETTEAVEPSIEVEVKKKETDTKKLIAQMRDCLYKLTRTSANNNEDLIASLTSMIKEIDGCAIKMQNEDDLKELENIRRIVEEIVALPSEQRANLTTFKMILSMRRCIASLDKIKEENNREFWPIIMSQFVACIRDLETYKDLTQGQIEEVQKAKETYYNSF